MEVLPGHIVREGHRLTVKSILGDRLALPIVSRGDRFYMTGVFPWVRIARSLETPLTYTNVASWLQEGGKVEAKIHIAHTPDEVPRPLYYALIGGGAHESWHRLYSRQGDMNPQEAIATLSPYLGKIAWAGYQSLLGDLNNVFEDVGIERLGCAEFPGMTAKMEALQDFILDQEEGFRAKAKGPNHVANYVFSVLRDLGLGYQTAKGEAAMAHYKKVCPEAVDLVVNGPLRPILDRSIPRVDTPAGIETGKRDLLGGHSLVLALQTIAILLQKASEPPKSQPKAPPQKQGESQPQQGQPGGGGGGSSGSPGKGDTKGGDAKGGDTKGGDAKGGDAKGGDAKGGDAKGGGAGDLSPSSDHGTTVRLFLADHKASGSGLKDGSSALTEAVKNFVKTEAKSLKPGEAAYAPFTTARDTIRYVPGKHDPATIQAIDEAKRTTSYVRTGLATLFRALEEGTREHGVRRGNALSERLLVDTVAAVRGGYEPTRAFIEDSETVDMSLAVAVVIDGSGSMSKKLAQTAGITYALIDALDSVRAKTMVSGFRVGGSEDPDPYTGGGTYFRSEPIVHDVFKRWDERAAVCRDRIASILATGGTPMADGIEFALTNLNLRKEGFRMVVVVTDGEPDRSHAPVVRGQIRRARDAGIAIVGVGLGDDAVSVMRLFDDHVWNADLSQISVPLIRKFTEISRRMPRRGITVKKG